MPRHLLQAQINVDRSIVKALYPPLEAAALAAAASADMGGKVDGVAAILSVYEDPDAHVGLYNYAKALETVEAGLLGGFYYQHFRLAGAHCSYTIWCTTLWYLAHKSSTLRALLIISQVLSSTSYLQRADCVPRCIGVGFSVLHTSRKHSGYKTVHRV